MLGPDFLWHPLGACQAAGSHTQILACRSYNFWSGIASDISELTLMGGAVALLRHHNCEQPGCWRLGHRHPEHGRPVCRKHYHHDVAPERG